MHRYIGLIWAPQDSNAADEAARLSAAIRRTAEPWQCRIRLRGMTVFEIPPERGGSRAYVLPNDNGIIIGHVFPAPSESATPATQEHFGESAALQIASSGGRHLVDAWWGNYIAFLNDRDTHRRYAIRDCSGKIPCYWQLSRGVTVVFSDVGDLASLRIGPLTINWSYISAFTYANDLQVRPTGFNEVTELLAGDCLELGPSNTARQFSLWNPSKMAVDDIVEDREEAVRLLRQTTEQCVATWAGVHDRILHSLSGGIDSAIVLGCITRKRAQPAVSCFTRYHNAAGEDERRYARLAAEQHGVELLELEWSAGKRLFDRKVLKQPPMAKPSPIVVFGMLDIDVRNELSRRLGADAIWTGQGGDHLYYQVNDPVGGGDFIRNHGVRRGLVAAVRDAARVSQISFWSVARSTWKHLGPRKRWMPEGLTDRKAFFVNRDALPEDLTSYMLHPWAGTAQELPHGKQLHIYLLGELVNRHRPIGNLEYAPEHHPLISQPLMELCLRIPSYVLLSGGTQRALARLAFTDVVPPAILAREDKGGTTNFIVSLIRNSAPFLRELLLDGFLAQERIINRQALEYYLDESHPMRIEHLFPLIACITSEVWVRSSAERAARAAA